MNKHQIFIPLLVSSLLWAGTVAAQDLPRIVSVPGGIAMVEIKAQTKPIVRYKNHRVMVIGNTGDWRAVVGIPLTVKPGRHDLNVEIKGKHSTHHFDVKNKQYEEQRITIEDDRKVNPLPVDMERISKERLLINKAKAAWSDKEDVPLRLEVPVIAPTSSPFGLKRFFNDQPRNPHSGLDLAATLGTPIKAAARGRIVNTGEYFFNGGTVFIEHGQGLITMYCHMDSISVKDGQRVDQGDTIGTVGKSGRVTGAHLHWSVLLNNAMVDPELFLGEYGDKENAEE